MHKDWVRFSMVAQIAALCLFGAKEAQTQPFSVGFFRPWAGYGMPNGAWLTGDFDGDGDDDLFHAVAGSSYAHVWSSDGSGSFSLSTYQPWAGYAIPNGIWLAGRFDGDGRSDVIHLVANTDYAHVWISRGDGTFAVSTFRPWSGYAIPNGVWLTGNFDGDPQGCTDLFHAVSNTDYAHMWKCNGDGTFTVSTFRPWNGYSIPNGVWLAGDFDGDRKTDVFHAVANTDYAHVWTSRGDGTFGLSLFLPWSGYGIPNGQWMAGDLDGDRREDVVHAVNNTDYVHIWRSTGGGAFSVSTFRPWSGYGIPNGIWLMGQFDDLVGADIVHAVNNTDYVHVWRSRSASTFDVITFSPWSGYGIPNGTWLTADINGDRKTDIVHLVGTGDYAHPWISGLPSATEVSVDGIEVSQAVQDMAHSVPLFANKGTMVRVYLGTGSTSALSVNGTLTITNTDANVTTNVASNAPASITPGQALRARRESLAASLNFPVPGAWTALGKYSYRLSAVTDAPGGAARACSNCGVATREVELVATSPIRTRIVGLTYTSGTPAVVRAPAAADYALTQSWLARAYPTGNLISTQATLASANTWPFNCNAANAELATMRNNEISNGTSDNRTKYAGLVSNAGGYMRGCGGGNVGSSPTGNPAGPGLVPVNAAGDGDASYGDWYTGHELGHCFGRSHPGFCNGNSSDDPGFPYPNGQISSNDGIFTGLDVGDAANLLAPVVLPGAQRFDIMTYCNQPQWPSAYTYVGIRAQQATENPAGTGAPAVREPLTQREEMTVLRGHILPARLASIKPLLGARPKAVVGAKAPPTPVLQQKLASELPTPALPQAIQPPPEKSPLRFDPKSIEPAQPMAPAVDRWIAPKIPLADGVDVALQRAELKTGRFISVVATVNLSKSTGKLVSTRVVGRAAVVPSTDERRAAIRFLGPNRTIAAEHFVSIVESSDTPPGEDRTGLIDVALPFVKNLEAIELLLAGDVVDARRISKQPPAVKGVEMFEVVPEPEKQEPRPQRQGLRWKAEDPEGDELTFIVEARAPKERTWETIAAGIPKPELTLDPATLERFADGQIRVTASDGFLESKPVVIVVERKKTAK